MVSKRKPGEEGARVSTVIKGSPDEVNEAHEKLIPRDPAGATEGTKDKDEKFLDTLESTEGYRIVATRRSPLKLNERNLKNEIYIGETPVDLYDIEQTIKEGYGGNIWAISIMNPRTNRKVAGKTLEIYEPAKPVFVEHFSHESEYPYPSRNEIEEESESPTTLMKKQMEFAQMQSMMNQLKGGGNNSDDIVNKITNKFDQLLASFKTETETRLRGIEDKQRDRRHDEELAKVRQEKETDKMRTDLLYKIEQSNNSIKDLITKKTPEGDPLMAKILETISKASDSKISSLSEQQKNMLNMMQLSNQNSTDLVKNLITQVSQRGDALEMVEKVIGVVSGAKGMMGLGEQEPLDLGSRVVNAIQSVVPQALDYFKSQKAQGKEVTREELNSQFGKLGDTMYNKLQQDISSQVKKEIGDGKPQITQIKPGQNPGKATHTVEASIKVRIGNTIKILMDEMRIRPRRAQWVEYAIDNLPEDILDAIAMAKTQDEVFNILKKHVEPNLVSSLVGRLALDTKAREWLKYCFEMLIETCKEKEEPDTEAPETPETPKTPETTETPVATG